MLQAMVRKEPFPASPAVRRELKSRASQLLELHRTSVIDSRTWLGENKESPDYTIWKVCERGDRILLGYMLYLLKNDFAAADGDHGEAMNACSKLIDRVKEIDLTMARDGHWPELHNLT